jgi:2-dehydro-3-deoxygluconokinase
VAEVVVKADAQGAYVVDAETSGWVPAVPVQKVLDATGAGDAFNAAYLASRFDGANVQYSASRGHRLAAEVIQHPGAIIPLTAMPNEPGTL